MLKRGDRSQLEKAEQRLAAYLAKVRENANLDRGITRTMPLLPGRGGVEQNLMGVGAEIVFARLMNIYPDLSTHVRRGGPDCHLRSGASVDVKATPYVDHPLLVVHISKRLEDADLYVLFASTYPDYEFVGWAPADRVLASVRDIGHGPSYVLEPSELEAELLDEVLLPLPGLPSREFVL